MPFKGSGTSTLYFNKLFSEYGYFPIYFCLDLNRLTYHLFYKYKPPF